MTTISNFHEAAVTRQRAEAERRRAEQRAREEAELEAARAEGAAAEKRRLATIMLSDEATANPDFKRMDEGKGDPWAEVLERTKAERYRSSKEK